MQANLEDIRSRSKHHWCWPVYLLRDLTLWSEWMFCFCSRQVICMYGIWYMFSGRNCNMRKTNECSDTKDIHQNIERAEIWTCLKGHTLFSEIYQPFTKSVVYAMIGHAYTLCPYRCLILICPWGTKKYFLSKSSVMAYHSHRDVGQEMQTNECYRQRWRMNRCS